MTLQVAGRLREAGQDHRIAVLGELDRSFVRSLGATEVPIWAARFPDQGLSSGLATILRLARLAMRERFDLLQGHAFRSSVAAGVAGRLVGVPAVATLHRIYYRRLERWLDPLLQHLWHSVVVDSCAVRDALMAEAGIRRTPIEVIPNFVGDEFFAAEGEPPAENGQFTILMAAHFTPVKGHRFALEALARLERSRPGEAELVLLGDGPLLGECEAQVSALGLERAVRFLGRRDDLGRWLRRADVVILPSLWEGFGVVLAEGMAAGKPAVAFDVGGASEVIVDGETGFLTPLGDAGALTHALERLRDDAALRERMGRAGRRRAETYYTASRVATSYQRFYERVSAA